MAQPSEERSKHISRRWLANSVNPSKYPGVIRFRGTFYLSAQGLPVVATSAASWRSAFQRGHEIGNHSYSHWSNQTLSEKTWQQVAGDVLEMESWLLSNIFSMTPVDHTYAYPQGNFIVGPQDSVLGKQVGACEYAALLSNSVSGARIVGSGENNPSEVMSRRFYISGVSISGDNITAFNQAKSAIDNGIANGTWTVLVFHSLGDSGDGNSVSQTAYTQIINYLRTRGNELWVAPVVTVKDHIAAHSTVSDWNCMLP
ncbi:MAG: polysaccharide deacetylase family protein [Luteimonas sp.]